MAVVPGQTGMWQKWSQLFRGGLVQPGQCKKCNPVENRNISCELPKNAHHFFSEGRIPEHHCPVSVL